MAAGWVKATASLYKLARRLTGTGSFHHLLGLLLPHAALGYGLEQPGDTHHVQNVHQACGCTSHQHEKQETYFSISGAQCTKS